MITRRNYQIGSDKITVNAKYGGRSNVGNPDQIKTSIMFKLM